MIRMARPLWAAAAVAVLAFAALPAAAGPAGSPASAGSVRANAIAGETLDLLYVVSDMHWHKGEYNHIVNLNRIVVAGMPDFVEAYENSGYLLWSMNRDDEAIAVYKLGAAANPRTYALYHEIGYLLGQHRKRWTEVVPYYEKALAAADCPPLTWHMAAHAYEKVGRLDQALKLWKRAADSPRNQLRAAAKVNRDRVERLLRGRAATGT
jgi:tetratricopeptide (TPR) repeat protein